MLVEVYALEDDSCRLKRTLSTLVPVGHGPSATVLVNDCGSVWWRCAGNPWTAVHRHQRKANAGGPKRSSGMPGLPVPAPIEEQYVGAQREPRHQIDAAQVERAVSQPIWDLREPLGVHPGLAGNGKGVGLGADEVMCGAQYACVRQVPPQVRVPKQLD
jgi:hypothetical protein